jgi:hypothetical protein
MTPPIPEDIILSAFSDELEKIAKEEKKSILNYLRRGDDGETHYDLSRPRNMLASAAAGTGAGITANEIIHLLEDVKRPLRPVPIALAAALGGGALALRKAEKK